jgi:hypothetical protein
MSGRANDGGHGTLDPREKRRLQNRVAQRKHRELNLRTPKTRNFTNTLWREKA